MNMTPRRGGKFVCAHPDCTKKAPNGFAGMMQYLVQHLNLPYGMPSKVASKKLRDGHFNEQLEILVPKYIRYKNDLISSVSYQYL
jgi:hypothetical protein